jgi:hypothetical protein
MPDTNSNTKWNAPKGSLNDRISEVDDYVLIGKTRDGGSFVMSSGDQRLAENLVHSSQFGKSNSKQQTEGAGFTS